MRKMEGRMDRNKVVEKFIIARNSDFRFIEMKELVDALMECAREETTAELDRRVYVSMKERVLWRKVQE